MISAPSVSAILHNQIRPREVSVCWATHDLMEVQKVSRVEWCQKMLCRFQSGHSTTAANIVTSGKNPGSTPTVPKQSAGRPFVFSLERLRRWRSRSARKKMVATSISTSKHMATVILENRSTATRDPDLRPPCLRCSCQSRNMT